VVVVLLARIFTSSFFSFLRRLAVHRFQAQRVLYRYAPLPFVARVWPALGPMSGGSLVTVTGGGWSVGAAGLAAFAAAEADAEAVSEAAAAADGADGGAAALWCRFGEAAPSPAVRVLSPFQAVCKSPKQRAAGSVPVLVTTNLQDFSIPT
jgi:hypothetical protein